MTRDEVQAVIDAMKAEANGASEQVSAAIDARDYYSVNVGCQKATTMSRAARMLTEALEKSEAGPNVQRERERQAQPGALHRDPLNIVVAGWLDEDEARGRGRS
jgi:hypothetical protein